MLDLVFGSYISKQSARFPAGSSVSSSAAMRNLNPEEAKEDWNRDTYCACAVIFTAGFRRTQRKIEKSIIK